MRLKRWLTQRTVLMPSFSTKACGYLHMLTVPWTLSKAYSLKARLWISMSTAHSTTLSQTAQVAKLIQTSFVVAKISMRRLLWLWSWHKNYLGCLQRHSWEINFEVNGFLCQYLLLRFNKSILTYFYIFSWITNAFFVMEDAELLGCQGCKVHSGFMAGNGGIIIQLLRGIRVLVAQYPDYKIVFTGKCQSYVVRSFFHVVGSAMNRRWTSR